MTLHRLIRFVLLAMVLNVAAAGDGFVIKRPADIEWRDAPNMPGLSGVILAGDPSKPGPYVMRGRFAPGFINPPHRHDQDRFIVVLSGTWYVGTGEKLDLDAMQALLRPFRRWIDADRVGLALALAIRCVPLLAELVREVMEARKARGAEGSILALAVPVIVRALRTAEHLGEALTARGFDD